MIRPIHLPEGPVLLSERRRDASSFSISINFPFGSRNEAPSNRGFVHFVEHMLFKGTARHDAAALWRRVERTGGYANGATDRDSVCIYCCVPHEEWRLAVELIAEAAFSSTFPRDEFEREKQVVLSEILQLEDEIEEKAYDAFLSRFWPDQAVAAPIAGTSREVEAVDRDSLYSFYRANFAPPYAVVSASGDVDGGLLAEVLERALEQAGEDRRRLVGDTPPAAGPPPDSSLGSSAGGEFALLPTVTPAPRSYRGYTTAPASQAYYFDAIQLDPPLAMKDFFGLGAVNSVLGDASSSRLFQKVREKLGLAYAVQSSFSFSKSESLVSIQVAASERKLAACVSTVEEETEKFFSVGITEDELAEAKSRIAGGFLLSLEDPEFRTRRLASWYMAIGEVPDIGEERAACLATGMDEVASLLGRLAAAPRGRYAYGRIAPGAAAALSLKEL